jgi:hypothetical protein
VLRRRHHPQAQTARKAEKRQKTYETNRLGRSAAEGVFGGAEIGLKKSADYFKEYFVNNNLHFQKNIFNFAKILINI